MSPIVARFVERGARAPLAFTADDPSITYCVSRGFVDLFIVPVRDGFGVGQRQHVARIEEGALFFGLPLRRDSFGVALVAIAPGNAVVHELPIDQVVELGSAASAAAAAPLVDAWVHLMTPHALPGRDAGGDGIVLRPNARVELPGGTVGRVGAPVLWVRVDKSVRVVGVEEPPRTSAGVFPFARGTGLLSSAAAVLPCVDTKAFLQHTRLSAGLGALHTLAVQEIAHGVLLREREERTWLASKDAQERTALDDALRQLAHVHDEAYAARSPRVIGADAVEAALQHVLEHLGAPFRSLPDRSATPKDRIDALARHNRLRTRGVVLRGLWWQEDAGPLVAFLESGTPVALLPDGPARYVALLDGERRVVDARWAATLEPFALSFFRPLPDRTTPLELARFALHGAAPDLFVVGVTGLLGGLFATLVPIATAHVFDSLVPGAQRAAVLQVAGGLLGFVIAAAFIQVTRGIALVRVETRVGLSLQAAVWDRLLALPVTFFRRYSSGDLADRAMSINVIQRTVSGVALSSILTGIFAFWNLGLLFIYDVRLAGVGALLALFAAVVTTSVAVVQVRLHREVADRAGKLNGTVMQLFSGIAKLRGAAAERRAFARWSVLFATLQGFSVRSRMWAARMRVFQELFPVLVTMALFASASTLPAGELSTGTFLAFQAALTAYTLSLLGLVETLVGLLHLVPQIERARGILEEPTETVRGRVHPGVLDGHLEAFHLTFRYVQGQAPTLDDVSFRAEPGEFVAIVGPSGSGKSTLLRLLLGFERAETGSIAYTGQDLAGLDPREVRRQLGVVLQGNQVLTGTIAENVAGATRLTMPEVWRALEHAALAADVRAMPMGVHTVLSEGGGTLSGGQRQRLFIARALASDPRILLFDEATSALDAKSQDQVMTTLERLRTTRIVIAHRLSTIRNADKIVVLVRGRVAQQGTYEELMAVDGPFRELARRQLA